MFKGILARSHDGQHFSQRLILIGENLVILEIFWLAEPPLLNIPYSLLPETAELTRVHEVYSLFSIVSQCSVDR